MAEIIIGKQRNGPIGIVKLAFIKRIHALRELWRARERRDEQRKAGAERGGREARATEGGGGS